MSSEEITSYIKKEDYNDENPDFHPSNFSLIKKYYEVHFWHYHRRFLIGDFVKKKFPNKNLFHGIEFGSGLGQISQHLEDCEYNVVCSEYNMNSLKFIRENGFKGPLAQVDINNIPYKDEFNWVGAFDVLEHFDEREKILSGLRCALKDDGYLFLTVPAYMFLWSEKDESLGHKLRYTRSKLTKELLKAGFKIKYSTHLYSFVLPVYAASNWLGLGREKQYKVSRFINFVLSSLCGVERVLLKFGFRLPLGSTIFIIAQK